MDVKKASITKQRDKYQPAHMVHFTNAKITMEVELDVSFMYKVGKSPKLLKSVARLTKDQELVVRTAIEDAIKDNLSNS